MGLSVVVLPEPAAPSMRAMRPAPVVAWWMALACSPLNG